MIIEAINKIQNVGRFINLHSPGLQFSKETIIYGRNTQGKSTLVSVLRSLKYGDPTIIEGKKTFGTTNDQKVEIRYNDNGSVNLLSYPSSKWNEGNDNILIFDNNFIVDNIFVADRITYDNQKNLNEIIIGSNGKVFSDKIFEIQERLDSIKIEKRKLTLKLQDLLPSNIRAALNIESFCSVPISENVTLELEAAQDELKILDNQAEILNKLKAFLIQLLKLDVSNIIKILTKTITFNPSTIADHINTHWNDPNASKEFLKTGLILTKPNKETCVFCGQALRSVEKELLEEFDKYFKGEYQNLQNEIKAATKSISNWISDKDFSQFENELIKLGLNIVWPIDGVEKITSLKAEILDLLKSKFDNLYFIPEASLFEKKIKSFEEVTQYMHNLIKKYDKADVGIIKSSLEERISILELKHFRSNKELKELCDAYKELTDLSENLKIERDALRKQLEDFSTAIFEKYKETINSNLRDLGADFIIEEISPLKKIIGENERIFTLVFYDQYKVSVTDDNQIVPNFKNTFSESDKRLLAFAFFIAVLKNDSDLDNKILVFDDPFSSFDEERKRDTIKLLKDISCDIRKANGEIEKKYPSQKLIFTHERNFFREIYHREFPNAVTLKISTAIDGGAIKASKLERCNVDEDFPDDEIVATIKKLSEIKRNCNYSANYESDCRIVMENILKRKYYFFLESEIVQRKSVRTFITKLKDKYDENDYTNMIRLCDSLNIELHDNSLYNSNGDHDSILRDFFKYIEKL